MIFQSPQAFWLLLAIPVVVGIFLYRRKFPIIEVPALSVWMDIGTPVVRNNWRNQLSRILLLLLQLALISMIIGAGAGPLNSAPPKASMVVVLDASATMLSMNPTGISRFEQAVARSKQLVAACQGEPRLILSSDVPVVANRAGKPLGDILNDAHAEPVDGRLEEAVDLAQSLAASMNDAQVVVISDFVSQSEEKLNRRWHGANPLKLIQVGEDLPDAGFVSAQVVWAEDGQSRIKGTVAAHGMGAAPRTLRAAAQGRTIGTLNMPLTDGITAFDIPVSIPPSNAELAIDLSLEGNDGLAINNHLLLMASTQKRRIAIFSQRPSALKQLFEASGNVDVQEFPTGSTLKGERFDLYVCDRMTASPQELPPGGAFLFVGCTDPFNWLGSRISAPADTPSSWEPAHPLLKDVFPEALRVKAAMVPVLDSSVRSTTVVESGGIPLIVDLRPVGGTGHAVYLLFDPYKSPAGSSLAFPLLVLNCLDFLAAPAAGNCAYIPTGASPAVGAPGEKISVSSPDGQTVALSNDGHNLRTTQLLQTGTFIIHKASGDSILPVNYVSARAADQMPQIEAQPQQPLHSLPWWPAVSPQAALAWAAIALCVLDMMLLAFGRMRI